MTDDRPARAKPRASPETFAAARRLYESSELTQSEIARRFGVLRASLCRMAKREGWLRPSEAARRDALLRNVRAKLDAEIEAAKRLFGPEAGCAGDDAGRAARNLTSLVRALRELARYDAEQGRGRVFEDADDACPDIDQFRRDLAARLAKLQPRDA